MSTIYDPEAILSENEEWKKLEEQWKPVDLEVDVEDDTPKLKTVLSSLDLKGTTFDSSFLFKKVRRKVGRQLSKKSTTSGLEYSDFISHLQDDVEKQSPKQFYFISGQIMSAASIEDVCEKIDDIFKSIEQLASTTSTVKKQKYPEVVQCSISTADLSFDDTEQEKEDDFSDIDRHIEEAFENLNSTMSVDGVDQSTLDSVTTLVRKYSSILNSPAIQCSPRRRRQCCNKFKELAEFWKSAFEPKDNNV